MISLKSMIKYDRENISSIQSCRYKIGSACQQPEELILQSEHRLNAVVVHYSIPRLCYMYKKCFNKNLGGADTCIP